MWKYGYGYATENYQYEGSYYYEDVPTVEMETDLIEAWNSGSL